MKMKTLAAVAVAVLGAMALNSCETATGTGALVGAGAGALIGRDGGYGSRGDTIAGAAIGAGAGALIGAAIDAENANRYGEPPSRGYPYGRRVGRGLIESPYPPHQVYDLRGVPRGGLVEDRVGRGYFRKP
jgi:predicted small secreted protein